MGSFIYDPFPLTLSRFSLFTNFLSKFFQSFSAGKNLFVRPSFFNQSNQFNQSIKNRTCLLKRKLLDWTDIYFQLLVSRKTIKYLIKIQYDTIKSYNFNLLIFARCPMCVRVCMCVTLHLLNVHC